MPNKLLLSTLLALLTGSLAAQTTLPPEPNAHPTWLIFDQPLDSVAAKPAKARRSPPARPAPARAARRASSPGSTSSSDFEATQGSTYVPLDPDIYRLIDRYAIKFGSDSVRDPHTSVRPYTRVAAASLGHRILESELDTLLEVVPGRLSKADRFNAAYLLQDNYHGGKVPVNGGFQHPLRTIAAYFKGSGNPADAGRANVFYNVSKDFVLRVNPVALLAAGKDNQNTDGLRYVNTRGVQVEGIIDQRLGFYAFLTDNQEAVPQYVQNRIVRDSIVPHEGYWKYFKTVGGSAYDFFSARGYVTYAATKHINVQLGHDRNFIGNGYRSLILSDYSTPYFFLKLNTRIWKLNYQNLFAELTTRRSYNAAGSPVDEVYGKKYLALHHLSLDVTPNFNVGLFESEVAGRPGRGPELQYFNPLIFYRAIEQQTGSADNALLGLDFKWNIHHTAQLYGQVMLDEFKLSEIRAGNGWWSNKQAIQVGGKYIDVAGIRNLDLQAELNYIRPYTYQHASPYTAYTNYMQPLAHPMGANLTEVLGVLSYQPLPRLMLVAKTIYTEQGLDFGYNAAGQVISTGPISRSAPGAATPADFLTNYGGNPLTPYTSYPSEYGNRTGQGNKSRLLHTDFTATYQPRLNLFLDAKLIARHQTYSLTPASNVNEVYASLALRWNIAQRLHEF